MRRRRSWILRVCVCARSLSISLSISVRRALPALFLHPSLPPSIRPCVLSSSASASLSLSLSLSLKRAYLLRNMPFLDEFLVLLFFGRRASPSSLYEFSGPFHVLLSRELHAMQV
jgi:hypothetical protein